MKYINNIARKQTVDYIISTFNKISVQSGECRYNFRCQYNSVHEAKKNKHSKIAMCVYIEYGYPIIHFINYNKEKFIDNTLGQWSSRLDFYFIKWIEDEDMWNVDDIFSAFRNELKNRLSWWIRLTMSDMF